MSLSGGLGVSDDNNQINPEVLEEDYCRHAATRFQMQWKNQGVFVPAVLRHYGVQGEESLVSALHQARNLSASFCIVHLGYATGEAAPGVESFPRPLAPLLLSGTEGLRPNHEHVERSLTALQVPSEWCQITCGRVTVPSWDTHAARQAIREQLQLAGFIGVHGVQVPLPYMSPSDCPLDEEVDWNCEGCVITPAHVQMRNAQLACLAADILLEFLNASNTQVKVWVRCDVCDPAQRVQLGALRHAMVYGYQRRENSFTVNAPESTSAVKVARHITVGRVLPYLYFSSIFEGMTVSTAWLGEETCSFEVPSDAAVLQRLMLPDVPAGDESVRSPTPHFSDLEDEEVTSADDVGERRRSRLSYRRPADLQGRTSGRWGTPYAPTVSLITFITELMRHRASPVFQHNFFVHYALMNYLYFAYVVDHSHDAFINFEDALQLPLQPLSHNLSSGVYEVFERDATKYRMYGEALMLYLDDFVADESRHHVMLNEDFVRTNDPYFSQRAVGSIDCLYVMLVGCGRGQLLDELFTTASAMGVRLRIFAVEKNAPAAAFTQLRFACEPEWQHLCHTFGHSVEVIVADSRFLYDRRDSLALPWDFGLCDVIVSELLGSFGDNELSPECIEQCHQQLQQIQQAKGMAPNPCAVSIPQGYTAWIAPLHSSAMEQRVLESAMKGLTVPASSCPDRHAAVFHCMLVCDLCRGVALCPTQPCWSFEHLRPSELSNMSRWAEVTFQIPRQGRCSGFVGFFTSLLYQKRNSEQRVVIGTEQSDRTGDMYSWFPSIFPLDPSMLRDFSPEDANATIAVTVRVERHVDLAGKRVWYSWGVHYEDDPNPIKMMNRDGWAYTMEL